MKIISWNIACLPELYNLFGTPKYRIENIINEIEKIDPDIFCLQEVFSKKARERLLIYFSKKYHIQMSRNPRSLMLNMIGLSGGLFIASKYPIIESYYHIYQDACGEDWFSEKGFLHIVVKKKKKRISIINTHLNADSICSMKDTGSKIRMKQIYDILSYISQKNKSDYNLICGDLNENYISKLINTINYSLKKSFKYIYINSNIFITCESEQLDYIIIYGDIKRKVVYNVISSIILSDHKIIECIIN